MLEVSAEREEWNLGAETIEKGSALFMNQR